jgi:hypothetical protein
MKKSILALLTAALLMALAGGCAGSKRLKDSFWPENFPAEAVAAVSEHLADLMAANYPPGYTNFYLAQTGDTKDELGPALETALRSRGFTLAPEKGGQALTVSYILDRVDDVTWYSRLSVSDGLSLTRTWSWSWAGDSLVMEAATRTGRLENTDGQK